MGAYLQWWCYYALLDKSGIHTVSIALSELETDKNGQTATLAVSAYMEAKADRFGSLFAQARKAFDYDFVKTSYQNCFLS